MQKTLEVLKSDLGYSLLEWRRGGDQLVVAVELRAAVWVRFALHPHDVAVVVEERKELRTPVAKICV
ncbi:hypothetical protein E2C01_092474 [Portunus trituberculatus]|uniref:Uncharacterized protein n=1 Tax=Portunus trituberculatus TaxID=210409 RepID=A0A5B7JRG9_PORTR|nr:hypothetical protein [Portunus trituberculatus]